MTWSHRVGSPRLARRLLTLCAALLFGHGITVPSSADENDATADSHAERLRLGERIYREGILTSGQPIRAVVESDIPVEGEMFACASCHLRSGLGTTEGFVITPRINAATLFAPLPRGIPWRGPSFSTPENPVWETPPPWFDAGFLRPAYTREDLARVIRTGQNSAGQRLDDAMPRFDLDEDDAAALLDYLEQLSAQYSPGVTDTTLSFATVVTEDVSAEDREAMLRVLEAYIDSRNAKPRHEKKRARAGPFYRREGDIAYRDIELFTWTLKGPATTWRAQLERHYADQPIFALLGGITTGAWAPVHDFCEDNRIPSFFPITERPVVSETDWYTLYLSKGLVQEGDGAARWLRRSDSLDEGARVVQLYRKGGRGEIVARAFEEKWKEFGRSAPGSWVLPAGEKAASASVEKLLREEHPQVLMLWLEDDVAPLLDKLTSHKDRPAKIIVAAGLLGDDLSLVPEPARDFTFITYPYSLPGEKKRAITAVKHWLGVREIPVTNLRLQANVYFLGWMLSGSIRGMRNEFYREYFMEAMDMMVDQDWAVAAYPRLSFGPGQRYASKGCYMVQLGPGAEPELKQKGEWVVH
jgi:hypothetical protein